MTLETRIVGQRGKNSSKAEAHVHPFDTSNGKHVGLVTLGHPFLKFNPEFHPFLNDTFGVAMNQTITFGGAKLRATVLHAGVNSGSADTGQDDAGTTDKLTEVGQNFETTVGPGALIHNTSTGNFAVVTAVDSDTILSLDTNIMSSGNNYVINDIWPGTAVAGTWNFADGGEITITEADNNDEATFTVDSSHVWKMEHFVSFTGKIDLATYDPNNNKIVLEFGLNGVIVGNSVNIDDFIDTGDFGAQTFVIPKAEFGLSTQTFNSMRITILRVGGPKPTIAFDNLQWENTGTPLIYKATTPVGTRFHISEIRIRIEDAISAVLTDGSMPNIDPSAILGVSSLTNGIVFSRVEDGKTLFSLSLKNIGDFLSTGSDMINITGDATNTGFTLIVRFPEPIILKGGSANNFLSFTINDTLANLTRFTAAARGALEV